MIPATNDPIDVNELMSRIRAEADRRRGRTGRNGGRVQVPLSTVPVLPKPPTVTWRRSVDAKKDRLDEMLRTAREKNDGSPGTPKVLRGLVRKQGSYNRILLDALGLLVGSNAQLNKQVRELTDSFDAQTRWLETLADHRRLDVAWMESAAQAISGVGRLAADLDKLRHAALGQLDELQQRSAEVEKTAAIQQQHINHSGAELAAMRRDLAALDELRNQGQESEKQLRELTGELNVEKTRIAEIQNELVRVAQGSTEAHANLKEILIQTQERHVSAYTNLEQVVIRNEERQISDSAVIKEAYVKLERVVSNNEERQISDSAFVKAQLSYQTLQLSKAKPVRKQGAVTKGQLTNQTPEALADHSQDAFYLAFENRFRGTRREVEDRLRVYLPFLHAADVTGKNGRLLDLGCGRGEFLELLKKNHCETVSGVDLNASMVEQCKERGLDAVLADCVAAVRQEPDNACELVSAIHLIEHLPFSALMALLAEVHRVLRSGGMTILETPNPRNILVGASDFYRDMTHRNPIHPDTLAFALENIGFTNVMVYFLADEKKGRVALPQAEFHFDALSAYVEVPRDYAVVARKA